MTMHEARAAGRIIELVLYRVRDGVAADDLLTAVAASTTFLVQQPGYLGREAGVADSAEWVDLVYWTDRDAAMNAAALFATDPEAQRFGALLERQSVRIWHFQSAYRHAAAQKPQR